MTHFEPQAKLRELIELPAETEWVEFKEAKNNFDFNELGRYFSALSNEANLKGKPAGWLLFGVTDKLPRKLCGSNYRLHPPGLNKLKLEISNETNHQITFTEIHEIHPSGVRIIMFEIPAPKGIPTEWNGRVYGRHGESISPLSLQEIDQIRKQIRHVDWSAQICEGATLNNLDPQAIAFARKEFKKKNTRLAADVDRWDDLMFLNKAKVCIAGKITRTSMILLGKNEDEYFLSPGIARITWILKDANEKKKTISISDRH